MYKVIITMPYLYRKFYLKEMKAHNAESMLLKIFHPHFQIIPYNQMKLQVKYYFTNEVFFSLQKN